MDAKDRAKFLRDFALSKPDTPDMLHDWVYYVGGVWIPRTKVCEHHVAPFDAFCMIYFETEPGTLIKGSRGVAGKTFFDAVLAWTLAITKGAIIKVLGGSEEQSKNVQQYLTNTHKRSKGTLWQAPYAPVQLLAKPPTMTHLSLKNGGDVEALRASQQSVRGPHPQVLILDEIDEMEQKIFDSATGQPMAFEGIRGQLVCSSTHQNVGGTFDYARKHARDKGWNVVEWCLHETTAADGFVTEQMIADLKRTMPAERYRIEVELQEPSFENRIFEDDVIEYMFDKRLGGTLVGQEVFKGAAGEEIILVPPRYNGRDLPHRYPLGHFSGTKFTHGVDWGARQDKTVVHTQENMPGYDRMAAWGSWARQSYHKMADHANNRVKRYGGEPVIDGTGLGTVMEELMDVPYATHEFNQRKQTLEMYNNFINACQRGEKVYAYIESLRDVFRFLTGEHLYTSDKHTPDEFIAAALEHKSREAAYIPVMGRG
jgi:hypothetical protein